MPQPQFSPLRTVPLSDLLSSSTSLPSPFLLPFLRYQSPPYLSQRRPFHSTPHPPSGHSKWASIKHSKGRADASKSALRSALAAEIRSAVTSPQNTGGDPTQNPRVAAALAAARRGGLPRERIEAALGKGAATPEGAEGEEVIVECFLPLGGGRIGVVVVARAGQGSKAEVLLRLRTAVKRREGVLGGTGYLFERIGRVSGTTDEVIEEGGLLEKVVEAGGEDFEVDDSGSGITIWADWKGLEDVAGEARGWMSVEVEEVVFRPRSTVDVEEGEERGMLDKFIADMKSVEGVVGVWCNAAPSPSQS